MHEGTYWFRRLYNDCKKMSRHIRFKRIKYGFYRIYWDDAYIGECYKEMPQHGYEIYEKNIHFENKKYYEKMEDRAEYVRKVKNWVEGYWESLDRLRTKVWLMRHNREFVESAHNGYKQITVK